MAWIVDTCLLLDIGLDDPKFAEKSGILLEKKIGDGLLVCPVTFVELAPAFSGQMKLLEEFLFHLGVGHRESWTWEDTRTAGEAWSRHLQMRRSHRAPKRPVADTLIGAFATRFQGLLTRNCGDFQKMFPHLRLVEP